MAVKKSSSVTPVKKVKITPVKIKTESVYPFYKGRDFGNHYSSLNELIKEGYDSDLSQGASYSFEKHLGPKEYVDFSFEISSTSHTCGFLEVGELYVKNSDKNVKMLIEMLDAIVEHSKGYTFFMNTNGVHSSKVLEQILPLTKHWTKVKTYLNPGSGRILTLWVTNN